MKRLFLCERPYPLYRTLVKCMDSSDENDIILSNHVEGMERMYPVLKKADIFRNVFFYNDVLYKKFFNYGLQRDFIRFPKNIFILLKKLYMYVDLQQKAARIRLPDGLNIDEYDEIYVNDASSTIMFFLCSRKKKFIWVEHAKNVFQSREPFVYILCFRIMQVLDRLGILYSLRGTSRQVKAVEVNNNENLIPLIRRKRILEVNIDQMIKKMPGRCKKQIFKLYQEAYHLDLDKEKPLYIVLTSPLYEDGRVAEREDQVTIIRNVINRKIGTDENVMIKPHPRDLTRYEKYFPHAVIAAQCISAEILNFADSCGIKIQCVYGFLTSSITAFTAAEHVECYSMEQLKQFY